MQAEDIIRKQTAAFNQQDSKALSALYAATAVVVDPFYPEALRGTNAIEQDLAELFTTFPDARFDLTTTIANGKTYAYEGTMAGTHLGPLAGPTGHVPATNKRIKVGLAIFGQLDSDGRVAEEHRYVDVAGILGQLGLLQ